MPLASSIYSPAPRGIDASLRQGEIVTNLVQARLNLQSIGTDEPVIDDIIHPYAIILSQDCDLEQDFNERRGAAPQVAKLLPNILFCEVTTAEELSANVRRTGLNSKDWRLISANKNERYQFLQTILAEADIHGEGLPELGIDFKRYFSIPTDEVYKRIEREETKRRSILNTPYLEHVCTRHANFLARIALPEPHFSEPGEQQPPQQQQAPQPRVRGIG